MSPSSRKAETRYIEKTNGGKYKCPSRGCLANFTNYTSLITHVQEIHRSTVLGVQYQLQSVQAQNYQRSDIESFRESYRKVLAETIQDLELKKEIYLPLIERAELKCTRQRIVCLEDNDQKLKEKYKELEVKCYSLKKENEALREHNNDYFVTRYYESQQEIRTLQNHVSFFEKFKK
ncbi:18883_t:CDS:2, partial [Racocetra fulgida]